MIFISWAKIIGNPIQDIRRQLGLNPTELSLQAKIARSTVNYLELGIEAKISDKIHKYFEKVTTNYDKNHVEYLYNKWIKSERKKVTLPPVAKTKSIRNHPFQDYLNQNEFTVTKICEYIKIPKYPVYHYIKPGMQEVMPETIILALKQCGMPQEDIEWLDTEGRAFYNRVIKTRINERREYDRRVSNY